MTQPPATTCTGAPASSNVVAAHASDRAGGTVVAASPGAARCTGRSISGATATYSPQPLAPERGPENQIRLRPIRLDHQPLSRQTSARPSIPEPASARTAVGRSKLSVVDLNIATFDVACSGVEGVWPTYQLDGEAVAGHEQRVARDSRLTLVKHQDGEAAGRLGG